MISDSEIVNILYLIILLSFILGGLFFRKDMSFKKVIKYTLIWFLIAVICIILYSYRFEFKELKQRVISEINPSSIRNNNAGQIIINVSQNNHFFANLEINGVNVRFMIDTGASDVVLSLADAKKIGINPKNLFFNKPYQTANGVTYGANIMLNKVRFGNILMRNINASINNADMGTSLLGMSFLRKFKRYEFYQDRLILTPF